MEGAQRRAETLSRPTASSLSPQRVPSHHSDGETEAQRNGPSHESRVDGSSPTNTSGRAALVGICGLCTDWVLAGSSVGPGMEILRAPHAPQITSEANASAALRGHRVWLDLDKGCLGLRERRGRGLSHLLEPSWAWLQENVRNAPLPWPVHPHPLFAAAPIPCPPSGVRQGYPACVCRGDTPSQSPS